MMNEIYRLCKMYGPLLAVPKDIDGPRFMAAIAWNESSCGQNVTPRHEAAYDLGGIYATRPPQNDLLGYYGSKAAYSYGPWQMMPCNARGFTPDELEHEPDKAAQAFMAFTNRYILGLHKAETFDAMAQCYNAGHASADPAPGVARYVADALVHYSDPRVKAALEAA